MESTGDPPSAFTATEEDGNAPNPRTPYPPMNINSLPDELLSEVLVRNSAEDIHQRARFVCKRWRRTIHRRAFVTAHFNRSSYGLIFPRGVEHRPTFVGAAQGGGIELSELSCKLGSSIMSSCNGLILAIRDPENVSVTSPNPMYALYIENPATERCLDLPLFSGGRWDNHFGIAFAAASKQYKVVAICRSDKDRFRCIPRCCILTVGVDDAWRHVETSQLSNEADLLLLIIDPLITDGFMHWAFGPGKTVLTMNVETEAFAESRAPLAPVEHQVHICGYGHSYLSTGKNLSVLLCCGKLLGEVWELNGETGEWKKLLPNIDCKFKIEKFGLGDDDCLKPIGWVKYPEILLLCRPCTTNCLLIYYLVNDDMESVELPFPMPMNALVHKKSMVWP